MTASETINRMIETILRSSTWTSAGGKNPVDNFLKELRGVENPDLESELKEQLKDDTVKENKQVNDTVKKVKVFDDGQVGEISRMTSSNFSNIKQMATDPTGFIIGNVFKKFAKGAGVIALAAILFNVINAVIKELFLPGRELDRRFKTDIAESWLVFRRREELQRLKQGFGRIIVTSSPRLRGGVGAVSDSYRELQHGNNIFPGDTFSQEAPLGSPYAGGGAVGKSKGQRRRRGL